MAVARDPHPVTVLRDAAVRAVRDAVRAARFGLLGSIDHLQWR